MQRALRMAQEAASEGEVPVGAVLVDSSNTFVAEAGNRCIRDNDPSAHAEMLVIRQAAALANNYRLPGCRLYVTLEPCIMCAGACCFSWPCCCTAFNASLASRAATLSSVSRRVFSSTCRR